MTRRTWLEVTAAFAAVFVAVLVWRELAAFPGDRALREWVMRHPILPRGTTDLSTLLSLLGTPTVAILTLVVAWFAARRRWSGAEANALLVAAVSVFVAELFQDGLGQGADQVVSTAYPSGHVVWAAAVFGLLGLRARRRGAPELWLPCLTVVVLMGPERVVTGAHGLSDVLGGYALGLWWALALDRRLGAPRRR